MKKQQQQQQQKTPYRRACGRCPSLRENQYRQRRTLTRQSQQQQREQKQPQKFEQQHQGQTRENVAHETHVWNSPQQRQPSVVRSTEEEQSKFASAATGRSTISAVSLLRALWPDFRDVEAADEGLKQEGQDRNTSSKSKEGRRFHASEASSNTFAAFFPPLGARGTEHNCIAAACLTSCPPLPARPADRISSSSSSRSLSPRSSSSSRPLWSAAGPSTAAPFSQKVSSFFAVWLPTPTAVASSHTTPHAVTWAAEVDKRCALSADPETVKKCLVPRGISEVEHWFSSNKAVSSSSSNGSTDHAETEHAAGSSREAAEAWRGVCSPGTHKAYGVAAERDARLRRRICGSESVAVNRYRRGAGYSMKAKQQESAANENSTPAVSPAPARPEIRRAGANSSAAAAAYGAAVPADCSGVVQSEQRDAGRTHPAVTRRGTLEAKERREQHALQRRECGKIWSTCQDKAIEGRGDVKRAAAGRGGQRDTRLQRGRSGPSGEVSGVQFFFGNRGTPSVRSNPMLQPEEQRQEPSSQREAAPAAAQAGTCETLGIKKDEKRESRAGEAGEEAASSSSFGWMDQLRKMLRQTPLLGGNSAAVTKKSLSRPSRVCAHLMTEDTGTEEELSDTELLLLQGVSISKLPEEFLQHASHGSEPCNVLVCVESAAAAAASSPHSPHSLVAAAAVCNAVGDSAAAQAAVPAAAPPSTPRSSGTSSTRSSGEAFSSLWEGTSFLPPSLASLVAAVNLRPWPASDAGLPSTRAASAVAYTNALCSSNNSTSSTYSSSNNSSINNSNSDNPSNGQNLTLTGTAASERSTCDNSSNSSSTSSHTAAAAVEGRDLPAGEDFESLFNRCRSSVTSEARSATTSPALPLHAVAVLRADGTSKTYWRVPAQPQQQQLQHQRRHQHGQHQQQDKRDVQQRSQRSEQGHHQPQSEQQAGATGGAVKQNAKEKEARKWIFIPLQQSIQEPVEQQPEVEQEQQQEGNVMEAGDYGGQLQVVGGPAETTGAPAIGEQRHSDDRQEQLHDLVQGSRPDFSNNSSSSSSSDTVETFSNVDAWGGTESADAVAANLPSESGCRKNGDSVSSSESRRTRNSGSTNSCGCRTRSAQEGISVNVGDLECRVWTTGESDTQSLLRQEKLQPQQVQVQEEEERTLATARPENAEEFKGTAFLSSNRRATGTARRPRSWAQSQYNTTQHRGSKDMQLRQEDLCTAADAAAEGQQGGAADDSPERREKDSGNTLTRQGAEGAAGVPPAESAVSAALGTAGPLAASAAETLSTAARPTKERSSQQQPTGWWAEFSKGVTDFFAQQQGVLLPDVDARHCEHPAPPASSGCAAAKKQQQHEEASPAMLPLYAPLGFSFSPAGLLGPYHLGVVSLLCEANVINEYTPVAGASAGSLAAVTIGLNLSAADVMSSVEHVNEDLKEKGTAQRLGKRLRKELNKMIPEDCAAVIGRRPGKVTVTYTHVFPYIHGAFVSSFFGKSDLIDCLMASCNIPFYFSKWPTVTCRGRQCVDGFFATKHKTFGCPDTGALRDVKVVPFYASTVRVSSAAQDCINPDLQLHDQQILHYLRAKALLRARARLLREQMHQQQQRKRQQGVHPQPAERGQHVPPQEQQQRTQQGRLHASDLGDTGAISSVVSGCLPLLPTICPLHAVGRESTKQHCVIPEDTYVHKKFQSNAEKKDISSSNDFSADQTESTGVVSQRSVCVSLSSTQTEAAAGATVRSGTQKQQHESTGAAGRAAGAGLCETSAFAGGASAPCASLFLAPASERAPAAGAADTFPRAPALFPALASSGAASESSDVPSILARPTAFSTHTSLLSAGVLSASPVVLPSAAGATAPSCGATAGAAALPAAAAAAAEAAAQRGEEVCAFESIYACPVCSPLGEICPPHHFSYYFHDPSSASFGCGAITSSASFTMEQDAAVASTAASPPQAGTANRTATAGSPSSAAATRMMGAAASTPGAEAAAAAPPGAAASVVPAGSGVAGSRKPDTAMPGRSSNSSLTPGAMRGAAAVLTSQIKDFAKGEGPAGPVASLTTLGAASGLLRNAAEETPDAGFSSKENGVNDNSRSHNSCGSSHGNSKDRNSKDVTDIPVPLSVALSSIVPDAADAAGQRSSATDIVTSSPATAATAPKPGASAGAVGVAEPTDAVAAPASTAISAPRHLRATDTTLSHSFTSAAAPPAAGAAPFAGPPPATATPAAEAAGLPAPAGAVPKPAGAVAAATAGIPPTAATSSAARKLASSSTTARQRRRLRACQLGGGLCMREKCGCTALPPLLRLSCSTQELLQIALEASPNETLRELFDLGRADAFRWLVLEYMRCEDDLIHRRSAPAKIAQQPSPADREATSTIRGATTNSRGKVPSAASTTRPTDYYGFIMPALRQRWKSVSGRWGRSDNSSSTAANYDHTSRNSPSFTLTPKAGKCPGVGPLKGEDYDKALPAAGALPAAAVPPSLASTKRNAAAKNPGRPAGTAGAAPRAAKNYAESAEDAHTRFSSARGPPHVVPAPPNSARQGGEQQSGATAQRQPESMAEQAFAASGVFPWVGDSTIRERQERPTEMQSTRRLRTPGAAKLLQSYPSYGAAALTATPAATYSETRATSAGAAKYAATAPAAAEQTTERTTKRRPGTAAVPNEHPKLQEEAPMLNHAATAPADFLASSDFDCAVPASVTLTGVFLSEQPLAERSTPAAGSPASAATDALPTSLPVAWKRGLGALSTPEETDAAFCTGKGSIARPGEERGAAAPRLQRRASIQHSNEKQRARRDRSTVRKLRLAVERNQYKAMLEKKLAGDFPHSDRRRSNICQLHAVERQRSRSVPSEGVARHNAVCRRCHAPCVQNDRAGAGVCPACQLEIALLRGKQQARNAPAGPAELGGLMRRRSSSCAETHTDGSGSSVAENGFLRNLLPVLLLLKDASLDTRYAHIYTHSNLWNGDGSRCMRPEEHSLSHVVSEQPSKKIAP